MAGIKDLKSNGHWPTLLAAFLYFDFSFMVWTMMGPLANEIAESLKLTQGIVLSSSQIATLISTPILAGAILRLVLGFFVDKVGAKKTAVVSQTIVVTGLFYAYFQAFYEL
jgi:NNP family nitrate/nitrite transporter-like MFS transporter